MFIRKCYLQFQSPLQLVPYVKKIMNGKCSLPSISFFTICGRYFSCVRGKYKHLNSNDIDFFQTIMEPMRVVQDADTLKQYNIDWLRSHTGSSQLLLRPKTTEEISNILKYCNDQKLAVCPQGGNTGLVCGSIPIFDEIVISTSLMNTIINFDENSGILQCQAGCTLENLENFVNSKGFTVPLDLGAKGSCHIGGNISTNAGGLRFLRYGSLHGNIIGLKAVLPTGEVMDSMNTMRKNNTGYDLKHIFIGSEGTLGIVTEAAILCFPKSEETAVAFLGCNSFDDVLKSAKVIKKKLHEQLSSLEMLDNEAADCLRDNLKITLPIEQHSFYILIELIGSDSSYIEDKLMGTLEFLMEKNYISNGTIATEPSHIKSIWSIRERITESLLREGCGYKYDISLPPEDFYNIVEVMRERLSSKVTRCVAYGHLGDGNLHFNATTKIFDPEVLDLIEPFIYKWTSDRKGSISAEHGIGYKKKEYLHFNKTPLEIEMMKSLKRMIDPNEILNPYKVLPQKL